MCFCWHLRLLGFDQFVAHRQVVVGEFGDLEDAGVAGAGAEDPGGGHGGGGIGDEEGAGGLGGGGVAAGENGLDLRGGEGIPGGGGDFEGEHLVAAEATELAVGPGEGEQVAAPGLEPLAFGGGEHDIVVDLLRHGFAGGEVEGGVVAQ
jgi:hypothetical protein